MPSRTLLPQDIYIATKYCQEIFCSFSEEELADLVGGLKRRSFDGANGAVKREELAVLYNVLLSCSHTSTLQRKICSMVFKVVHRIHYRLQRELLTCISIKRLQQFRSRTREWRFSNNRLVKHLMVQG